MVETETAIKLIQELKVNKLFPKYNDASLVEIAQDITKNYIELTQTLS